ncbi:MAG: hypothetical protein COU66_00740 [Candidatus Pacebacteria bacterium CG10_big_fil_rev_8_21_14_0_10_44_11]|nr:MAG: hypothetical protein COU66_00740 [Candidatus Pacebacteria bacterium CG10_big_fil_rev_8_21_14_0_10_44_11]
MSIKVHAVTTFGLAPIPVEVEVLATSGLPQIKIIGAVSASTREAKDRVVSALKNLKVRLKARKTMISLRATELSKHDTGFDLAIAVGLLALHQQLAFPLASIVFIGEVSLEGEILPVPGCLAKVLAAKQLGFTKVVIPFKSLEQVNLVDNVTIYALKSLSELLTGQLGSVIKPTQGLPKLYYQAIDLHLQLLVNQQEALRALTIAIAGNHHLRLVGPPGIGKTVLPQLAKILMPPLSKKSLVKVLAIHSLYHIDLPVEQLTHPPFQMPAHSVTPNQLLGNFNRQQLGELSLAKHGILFFDELSELSKPSLQIIKDVLERSTDHCLVIAASNPCLCGYWKTGVRACRCSAASRAQFDAKLSGSFLDRFDLHASIVPTDIAPSQPTINLSQLQIQVQTARQNQELRYTTDTLFNGQLDLNQIAQHCRLPKNTQQLLRQAMTSLKLSLRAYQKTITVAQTIADLESSQDITEAHLAEALNYRFEQSWDP